MDVQEITHSNLLALKTPANRHYSQRVSNYRSFRGCFGCYRQFTIKAPWNKLCLEQHLPFPISNCSTSVSHILFHTLFVFLPVFLGTTFADECQVEENRQNFAEHSASSNHRTNCQRNPIQCFIFSLSASCGNFFRLF